MRQTIAPNPNIPCQPGWCLAYVNEAFGVPKVYPSATSAWFASKTKHTGRDFPSGVWVPVWYGLDSTPLGHVVLLAPDGSVYSTSDLTNVPHHHPNLADLESYYAYYGMTLTYRGWTEDVEGTRVMTDDGSAAIAPQGTTVNPIKGFLMALTDAQQERLYLLVDRYLDAPTSAIPEKVWSQTVLRGGRQISVKQELADAKTAAQLGLKKTAPTVDVKALAADVAAHLTTNQAHQFIVALGQALPKE